MTRFFNPNIFRESEICPQLCHRLADFLAMRAAKIKDIDFLCHITRRPEDVTILQNWIAHFRIRDIPFAVTLTQGYDGTHYVLWKKDERLLTKTQLTEERNKPGVRWFREGDNKRST